MFYDLKDRVYNALICYLLSHCGLWSHTVRMFINKLSRTELEYYIKDEYQRK